MLKNGFMHALKKNFLLRLQTLANLDNYHIIMIEIIINSLIATFFLVIICICLSRSS